MKISVLLLCLLPTLPLSAQNIQWRNDRTGIFHEKNLLTSWPAKGPDLLWHCNGLGDGYSSVAIDADKLYVTGMTKDVGFLYVLDLTGKIIHKKSYGNEWAVNYNGSRGTITVNDGKLYLFTGTGSLICMDQKTLDILWKKNIADFGGRNIMWGVCESPLIVGEKVILTVGGKQHNVVALNKNNGSLIWSCSGEGDVSAYCSPLYIADQQIPQIVTMMAGHILGIEAATGKKLWSYKYENNRKIHPNTPIYHDNMLLCTSGYNKGAVMLRLTHGGGQVEKVWEQKEFESRIGGGVKIGDYVYAGGDPDRKYWFCVEWKTGTVKYKERAIATGAVIANDNMLYCYTERGEMALVRATSDKFDLISKFNITLGTAQHWAHPVIYQGVLYIRHGNTLMAYKVK